MAKYRCNVETCQGEVEGMLFRCPHCGAVGKGFTQVGDSAPPVPPSPPPQPVTSDAAPPVAAFAPPQPAPAPVAPVPPRPVTSLPASPVAAPAPSPASPATPSPRVSTPFAPPLDHVARSLRDRDAAPAVTTPPPPPCTPARRAPEHLAWRYPPTSATELALPLRGGPAVDAQGRVFICRDHELLMFPRGGCTPAWRYETGGAVLRSPAIGLDGNVRVHSGDGRLHVVTPDGRCAFEPVAVGEPLGWASPLVDSQNNTWICRHAGGLAKVDAFGQTGRRPFYRMRHRFDCTGLIHGGTLYIGCEEHYVYAIPLDGDSGRNLWSHSIELGRTGCAIHCPLALGTGGELLAISQDDRLYAFGLDGQSRWSVPLPGHGLSSPVVDEDGTIYVGLSQNPRDEPARGVLLALRGATRQMKWQYAVDAAIESTPVIGDDGIVYFGDNDGVIHAVDPQGKLVWKTTFESPIRSAGAIIDRGLVAFGADDGSLLVLKCSSQAIRSRGWPKLLGAASQNGLVGGNEAS